MEKIKQLFARFQGTDAAITRSETNIKRLENKTSAFFIAENRKGLREEITLQQSTIDSLQMELNKYKARLSTLEKRQAAELLTYKTPENV